MRILCLSDDKEIGPMWEHYADNNKGIVLEFNPNAVPASIFLLARKVNYQNDPPFIGIANAWANCFLGLEIPEKLFTEYIITKKASW